MPEERTGPVAGELPAYAERVLDVADAIPPGRVMSYGDIAEWLGEGGPRQVGRVMALYGGAAPWWRVVRADGTLLPGAEPRALAHYREEGTPLRQAGPASEGTCPGSTCGGHAGTGCRSRARTRARRPGRTAVRTPAGVPELTREGIRPGGTGRAGRTDRARCGKRCGVRLAAARLRVTSSFASSGAATAPGRSRTATAPGRSRTATAPGRSGAATAPGRLTRTTTPTRTGDPRELLLHHPAYAAAPGTAAPGSGTAADPGRVPTGAHRAGPAGSPSTGRGPAGSG